MEKSADDTSSGKDEEELVEIPLKIVKVEPIHLQEFEHLSSQVEVPRIGWKEDDGYPQKLNKLNMLTEPATAEDLDGFLDGDAVERIIPSDHESESEQEYVDEDFVDEDGSGDSNCYIGINGKTRWTRDEVLNKLSRIKHEKSMDMVSTTRVSDIKSEISAFEKIIDGEIVAEVVRCTNVFIERKRLEVEYQRYRDAKSTCIAEILALFGLLYLMGIKKLSRTNVMELWDTDGTGLEISRCAMSYKRFLFLLRCLQFDDKFNIEERKKVDNLAPIRTILDKFVNNCRDVYSPGRFLTIDEKLEPFRGNCSFVQYIPRKPARYGIKIYAMCDSETFFTCNLEVYCGEQPGDLYDVSNEPKDIVLRLVKPIENSDRNVTFDNWYTSYDLAKRLCELKITCIGAVKKSAEEIPPEFMPRKNRIEGSSLYGFQEGLTLVSFVPKKNRAIILLSTMHDHGITDPKTNMPQILLDYNKTKGGVDIVDQLCSIYTVSRITRRWPLVVFFSLMNIAGINAQVLYDSSQKKPSFQRRMFLKNLALSLMKPHLVERSKIPYLPADIKLFLAKYKEEEMEEVNEPPEKRKRGRCVICGRSKNRTTTITCDLCRKFTCKKHTLSRSLCVNCSCNSTE